MGPNMQKMLDNATKANDWLVLGKDRADKRACESLVKAGALQTRTNAEGKTEYALTVLPADKPKATKPKATKKADKPEGAKLSNMQKAIMMASDNPTMTRQDFMKLLQAPATEGGLGMTPAGANTYSSAAMKAAKAKSAKPEVGDEPTA